MARRRRTTRRRPSGFAWSRAVFAGLVAAALGAGWLIAKAERTLSRYTLGGLGESFSTRIWSAPFTVRDGARTETAGLLRRLDRLGYRRVDADPGKGEYVWDPPELDVFLRGYRAPGSVQVPELVRLRRTGGGAWRLADSSGERLDEAALEPELAAELSGARKIRRDPLTWDQIPPVLREAVVSAEDKRFWTHWGLDPRAIARALWADARGHNLQGASTITQQLAKNLFLSPRRTLTRKVAEAALSVYLDRRLGKKRVLTLYLNSIYMGQDGAASIMGMRAASRFYFAKDPRDLTLSEAATLAGMIRGPGFYDPLKEPKACRERRDQVLRRMRDNGYIDARRLSEALGRPVDAVPRAEEGDRRDSAYYTAEVVRRLLPRYGGEALYRNGLSIYTAMDPVLQSEAQKAVHRSRHQAALVALDPRTGDVLALVGGKDFTKSQFNRATQARRQTGSAFKPFVYAAAIKMGLTPATILLDRKRTFHGPDRDWTPDNDEGVFFGTATMRTALSHSLNAATLDLLQRVGIKRVQDLARACGIESPLRNDLGLGLGGSELGLLELTSAYDPFVNEGRRAEPRLVLAVTDSRGGVLEAPPPESKIVLDPAVAYVMTSLMESVVKSGTARSLKRLGFDRPAAGKTGTTNDGRDAWFVGYTSSLLTGVWVGADDNRALKLFGASDALPVWASFMKEASADYPADDFVRPPGVVEVRICPDSGMLARSGCPHKLDEVFVAGTEPTRECVLHRGGVMGWLDRLTRPR